MPETRNDWAGEGPLAIFEAKERVVSWPDKPHNLQVQKSCVCDDLLVTVRQRETPRESTGLNVLRLSPDEFRELAQMLTHIGEALP